MAAMSRVLIVIPARGGSRRVPGKNLRTVTGFPLVGRAAWIARAAIRMLDGGPHLVVCSTDDQEIAATALAWGADRIIERPPELATAKATTADAAVHAMDAAEALEGRFDACLVLQPTAVLVEPSDLARAIRRFLASDGRTVVGAVPTHPGWWHLEIEPETDVILDIPLPATTAEHHLGGTLYIVSPEQFRADPRFVVRGRSLGFVLPPERSIDIDEAPEFVIAEALAAAQAIPPVPFGDRMVGDGSVLVIAEAGVNHDGDVERAHRLVDAAADTGADAVKFQTFDPTALATSSAPTADYQRAAGEGEDQQSMLARLTLPASAWAELQAHARERDLVFLSTPFDLASARLLDELDVPAFKVGSGELTNIPFLRALAGFGRPMLISTGMADLREVAEALDAVAQAGDPPVALFHCVSAYPAPHADANLRAIGTLRAAFGVPVGWSDHTPGIELPVGAVALGAAMVEKHLTLDRTASGPDHAASLEPDAFGAMVAAIRSVASALGDGVKRPAAVELPVAAVVRRSLFWARALGAGETVAAEHLVALRPASGLPPGQTDRLIGGRTTRAVAAGAPVTDEDVAVGRGPS